MNNIELQSLSSTTICYGPLANDLGYLLRRAQLWIFNDFIRQMAPLDLRPAQYAVLVIAAHNPGLSQITLASSLGIERARLVRLLDQLEERKLVERRPSATDRRSHAVHLTPQGEELMVAATQLINSHHSACHVEFGGEDKCAALTQLLATFRSPSS